MMHATREEGKLIGHGGLELYLRRWPSNSEASRGIVGIVHGIAEHSGRYAPVVERLCADGFDVYGYDLRGHGHSPGKRVHISNWTEYRVDLAAFVRCLQGKNPRSLFLYGHSMGALITLDYLLHEHPPLQGAIFSGVPLEPANLAKPHLVAIAKMLSRLLPTFTLPIDFDPSVLSRNASVVRAYTEDPLIARRVTTRFATESLAAVARCKEKMSALNLPVLILHGGGDRLIRPEGSRSLFEAASSSDKTLHIYPGVYHEPHNDLDSAAMLNDLAAWLSQRG